MIITTRLGLVHQRLCQLNRFGMQIVLILLARDLFALISSLPDSWSFFRLPHESDGRCRGSMPVMFCLAP
jgi:hypothetical protein